MVSQERAIRNGEEIRRRDKVVAEMANTIFDEFRRYNELVKDQSEGIVCLVVSILTPSGDVV